MVSGIATLSKPVLVLEAEVREEIKRAKALGDAYADVLAEAKQESHSSREKLRSGTDTEKSAAATSLLNTAIRSLAFCFAQRSPTEAEACLEHLAGVRELGALSGDYILEVKALYAEGVANTLLLLFGKEGRKDLERQRGVSSEAALTRCRDLAREHGLSRFSAAASYNLGFMYAALAEKEHGRNSYLLSASAFESAAQEYGRLNYEEPATKAALGYVRSSVLSAEPGEHDEELLRACVGVATGLIERAGSFETRAWGTVASLLLAQKTGAIADVDLACSTFDEFEVRGTAENPAAAVQVFVLSAEVMFTAGDQERAFAHAHRAIELCEESGQVEMAIAIRAEFDKAVRSRVSLHRETAYDLEARIDDGSPAATDVDAGADFAAAVSHAREAVQTLAAHLQERLDQARRFPPAELIDREVLVREVNEAMGMGVQVEVDGKRASSLALQNGSLTWRVGSGKGAGFRKHPASASSSIQPEAPVERLDR